MVGGGKLCQGGKVLKGGLCAGEGGGLGMTPNFLTFRSAN